MKKVLLLSVAAISAVTASAVKSQVFEDLTINKLSPDGSIGASDMYDTLTILDLENNKRYDYTGDGEVGNSYSLGNGNPISSTGIVVGCMNYEIAAYWEAGEWKMLPMGDEVGVYGVNGISADGKRMCGIVPSTKTGETTTLPAVWTRNDDGTYGMYEILPHPTADFTGRDPQYITAVCISDDGKTVAGQVLDYMGMMAQPIVYRLNDKNEWEYELIHPELLNVNNTEFPEWSEGPDYPSPENYMSPEEKEAYDEAYNDYLNSGYDPEKYPKYEDFLTPEEIAEWQKDADIYNEWVSLNNEFVELIYALQNDGAALFEYNNVCLSANGRYYGSTAEELIFTEGNYYPESNNVPYIFDLETGEYKKCSADVNLVMSFIADNGDALAGTPLDFLSISLSQAYALKNGTDKFIPLVDFLADSQETVKWMTENMSHDGVIVGTDENYQFILEDNYMVTGVPTSNADMSIIATWTTTDYWDINNYDKPAAYSYVICTESAPSAGVAAPVAGGKLELSAADGTIFVNGEAASLVVYDLNGRDVFNVANPGSKVVTDLAPGFYVVKAVAADGESVTVKATF